VNNVSAYVNDATKKHIPRMMLKGLYPYTLINQQVFNVVHINIDNYDVLILCNLSLSILALYTIVIAVIRIDIK
jgi:hypothetical protein